jgi:serine-type D-Ala-D-Ala carboxypeptidase/endopeptidase (penicillin-binding protein 4)
MTAMAVVALAAGSTASGALAAGETQRVISTWSAANPGTSALVWRLDGTGRPAPVASYRAGTPRIPASTMKLVTSAGALLQLGPAFRFRTELLAAPGARLAGGTLTGAVYLKGAGDPVLATRRYSRTYLAGVSTPLARVAREARRLGVRRIRGPVVADERLFDSRRTAPSWPGYYSAYASPLSALATNQDYSGETRSAYVSSPPLAAAQRLRGVLRANGVAHSGGLRVGATPARARPLGAAVSRPLPAILREMNHESDNFIAETLAKDVGAYGTGRGTTAAGVARTHALLRDRGIVSAKDTFADGSGLSRSNRIAATSLVRLIAAADVDRTWGTALIGSLAQGGQGTLVRRFRSGVATRRVRAKTGYINNVSALAGRVVSRRGERYAFALLMNTSDIGGAKAAQDRVVTLLAAGAEDRARAR